MNNFVLTPVNKKVLVFLNTWLIVGSLGARLGIEFKIPWLEYLSIFMLAAFPFALFAIFLKYTRIGIWVLNTLSIWHFRIFYLAGFFAFVTYSNKWAGDYLNDLFEVDPSHFGTTQVVLATLMVPLKIVYIWGNVISSEWAYGMIDATAYLLLFGMASWEWAKQKQALDGDKRIITKTVSCLVILLGWLVFVFVMSTWMANKSAPTAMKFAVWADFNEKNRCIDEWLLGSEGVVFLGESKVLAFFNTKDYGKNLVVGSCTTPENVETKTTEGRYRTRYATYPK